MTTNMHAYKAIYPCIHTCIRIYLFSIGTVLNASIGTIACTLLCLCYGQSSLCILYVY